MVNTHAPAHNFPAEDVNNRTQVIPPAHTSEICKVTRPYLVRRGSDNALIFEDVWGCRSGATVLLVVPLVG